MSAVLENIVSTIRPYQNQAIRDLYKYLGDANYPILKLPTGAGKTYIAAAIIAHATKHGKKVLFLVDRLTLLGQTTQALYELGIYASVIQGPNTTYKWGDDVVVASIQTLEKRKEWPDVDLIIVDEAHDQRLKLADKMEKWDGIKWVGMTATPYTTGLGNTWSDVIDGPTVRELIDQGYLCDFEAYGLPIDLKGVRTTAGDYNTKDLEEKVNTTELNGSIVKHYLDLAADRKGIIFATNIAHSKAIAAAMTAAGIPTEHIDCYSDDDHKFDTIADFRAGKIQCLTSVGILSKGFDVKDISAVVLARPTKSLSLYIQQVGRGLRTAEGKQDCIILDHASNVTRHGMPDADFSRPLCTKKKGVSGSDHPEKEEPLPKACIKCEFIKPPKVHECPKCGFKPEKQSEIVETSDTLVKLRGTKNKTIPKANKQTIYSQLLHIAKARGYKSGWVAQKYRTIFDVWPAGMIDVVAQPSEELQNWITSQNIAWAKRNDK